MVLVSQSFGLLPSWDVVLLCPPVAGQVLDEHSQLFGLLK